MPAAPRDDRGKTICVELPNTVTLETGAAIMVPFHVISVDKIRVDTEHGRM